MRRRSGVLVSRGQVVITEKAEGGRSDRGDGMKDGSGLALVRLALRLSRPPQAAGRTKLELRVRHTKAKGRKAARRRFFTSSYIKSSSEDQRPCPCPNKSCEAWKLSRVCTSDSHDTVRCDMSCEFQSKKEMRSETSIPPLFARFVRLFAKAIVIRSSINNASSPASPSHAAGQGSDHVTPRVTGTNNVMKNERIPD